LDVSNQIKQETVCSVIICTYYNRMWKELNVNGESHRDAFGYKLPISTWIFITLIRTSSAVTVYVNVDPETSKYIDLTDFGT